MKGRTGLAKVALIGGLAAVLVAGGGVGAVLVVKSKRDAAVRDALAFLPAAEQEFRNGKFAKAVEAAAEATRRHRENPTWFQPGDEARIKEVSDFLAKQLDLWKRIEATGAAVDADPAKARAELEKLAGEVRAGAEKLKPLAERVEPLLQGALEKERAKVEDAAVKWIPEALEAYEKGTWDGLLGRLEEIRAAVGALPEATRSAASARLDSELKPIEAIAGSVSSMRAIRASKEDASVKADRLRDLIGSLNDLKGRDQALHRDLRKAIAEVDPENRTPLSGVPLSKENHDNLTSDFTKGNGLEVVGNPNDYSVIELQGPAHRYAIRVTREPMQFQIEVDRVRMAFAIPLVSEREALALKTAENLSRALRAARPSRLFADEPWIVASDGPGLCAYHLQGVKACVFLDGRLFDGTVPEEPKVRQIVGDFISSGRALEKAVRASEAVPDEFKGPLSSVVKASFTRADPGDHLDGQYCREAINEGYLEAQLPKVDAGVAAALKDYRQKYSEVMKRRPRFEARAADGATIALTANMEGDSVWRLIDPAAQTTTFSSSPRDHMGTALAAVSVFAGTHTEFPNGIEPVEVRMSHGVAGTLSRWTAADGKLQFDAAKWAEGVALGQIPEHFGSGAWQVPPHVLKVDGDGQARELILPRGKLVVGSFDTITAGPARVAAEDKFIQNCADVLREPGEYHLFYRYFVQYVLDSPVTTATTLIGSAKHCGDAHQSAYQTLDRRLNGRFLADCDDLAELYWTILRKQNRPAFVLGVPGHATCGVAEKEGDAWSFFCVDTGPTRGLKGPDLDAIVEKLLRTYDQDGSMTHDPRQMRFLFRFAEEQTRNDFFLDSRILRDPEYADLMIQVQEYWHFGFYALGIERMSKVLETDKMPANCQEIAGLYTRVGMWEEALKWTKAGIAGLDAKDRFTGLSESNRIVNCLRELKRKEEAGETLKKAAAEIAAIVAADPSQADRYRTLKFGIAANLAQNELPWEGWALVKDEVVSLVEAGHAAESLMAMVVNVFGKMNDAIRAGKAPSDKEKRAVKEIGELLEEYFKAECFKPDDSNLDLARKYGHYFLYQAALMGMDKATAELAKPELAKGKRPDIKGDATPALTWPWIRLSPVAYMVASGSALDKDEPKAGGPKVAIEVVKTLEDALPEIRKQGSLGTLEFQVLDLKLIRGCLQMDEAAIRAVFTEMKRQHWGALYESLSQSLGTAAGHMKSEDFVKVFKIYCEYNVPRRHYYGVVYSALAAEAREHAVAASKICIEKFPDDKDMKREHELLLKLKK